MAIDVYKLMAMGANSTPTYEEALKNRFIVVQDNSDGNGAYIREWNHADAQPSDVAINAFDDLPNYKEKQKAEQKSIGNKLLKEYAEDIKTTPNEREIYRAKLSNYLSVLETNIDKGTENTKKKVNTVVAALNWSSV